MMSAMKLPLGLTVAWMLSITCNIAAADTIHFVDAERLVMPISEGGMPDLPKRLVNALPESGWQHVQLPDVGMQRVAGKADENQVQTIWYRFQISPQRVADSTEPHELFFYMPRWQTVGQVSLYGDNRLLWRSRGDFVWNAFNQPVWVNLDPPEMTDRVRTVLLRIDSVPGLGSGISSAWIGPESTLAWRYQTRMALQVHLLLITGIAFAALGLFCLAVWYRRRQENLYLLCFMASLFFAGRYLHYVTPLNTSIISSAWFGWMSINSLNWLIIVILIFNLRLCKRHYPKLELGMLASVIAQSMLTLPLFESSEKIASLSSHVYLLVFALTFPACILALRAAWKERSGPGLTLALVNVIGFPFGAHDIMLHGYTMNMEQVYLLPLAQMAFFIIFAFIILRRYVHGIENLERGRELLALRLQERETELAASYEKLREVERRDLLSRERQRLMRDMHDGLGGSLTGMLRMMDRDVFDAEQLKAAVQECVDELRLTIDSLEPVDSDISVLLAGLRFRLQPRLNAAGIRLSWRVEALPPLPWLTPAYAIHVIRIVQEVVTNIVKHAGASEIVFFTHADALHASICIEDNGQGYLGVPVQETNGRGLNNVRYRASLLNAKVTWAGRTQTAAPSGMRFSLDLPLSQIESEPAPS